MNTRSTSAPFAHIPPMDSQDEPQWQAQEHARAAVRNGGHGRGDEAAADRIVARALRDAPLAPLPAQFAYRIAHRALRLRAADTRLERWLTGLLMALLAFAALVTSAYYGSQWWDASRGLLPLSESTLGWALLGAGCLAVSWSIDRIAPKVRSVRMA